MTTEAGNRYRELVAQALEAAGAVDDQELKRIAFEHVLDHLLGNGQEQGKAPVQGAASTVPTAQHTPEPVDSSLATEQQRIDAVARYFDIEPDQVLEIFDLAGEEPALSLNSKKLPTQRSRATQDIALLIGGVRTAVGLETSTSHIREATEAYDKYDSPNFMTTLGKMNEIALLGKPRSSNRLVRMRVIGAEAVRPLAQKLVA